ncbi:rhomboid family intramembrane serine protease [Carboxylicivirga sp. A043]|uniref:rhomboid family intramembrane serine protease n=1 Tax=Carboxylicivirga litoralis TaxID=2816963 RepID=UPI0021CB6817|nr:rhomboid family intramembrane serine protease [Carboxylicivirga sp. A043]MCU4158108.1 rhomboid family intramembrane serine protease [Carboxylicivirga sp. A043]
MTKLSDIELKKIKTAILIPLFFLLVTFSLKLIETLEGFSFVEWGIKPMSIIGLPGILLSPLVHSDWGHFFANAVPLFVLGTSLFYFYRGISVKVFVFIYLLTGIWVWLGARDAWHIGASGVIYGLAAFLIVGGFIRNYIPLMAISLMVIFLYGGMIWGIFPLKWDVPYSWESHLWGSVAGAILAIIYRKKGPQKPVKEWPDEEYDHPFWEVGNENEESTTKHP